MIGLLFALAPFFASIFVARREPAHRPIRDALGASAAYSAYSLADAHLTINGHPWGPFVGLALWGLVALVSGLAYLRAFALDDLSIPAGLAAGMTVAVIVGPYCTDPGFGWAFATWGPFVASSVVGALALWRWWSAHDLAADERTPMSIAQRVALLLLASDVCMLAFIRWPGVQIWQGRCAAVAIAGVQVMWLFMSGSGSDP